MPSLGEVLRAARERRNMSQRDVADAVGVSRAAIAQWESDETAPKRDRMADVARVLGLPLSAIDPWSATAGLKELDLHHASASAIIYELSLDWLGEKPVFRETNRRVAIEQPSDSITAFLVPDDAMAPDYRNGDIVLVAHNVLPRPGDAVVAASLHHRTATLRFYLPRGLDKAGETAYDLQARSPDYATVTVNSNHPARIIGVVVELRRRRAP